MEVLITLRALLLPLIWNHKMALQLYLAANQYLMFQLYFFKMGTVLLKMIINRIVPKNNKLMHLKHFASMQKMLVKLSCCIFQINKNCNNLLTIKQMRHFLHIGSINVMKKVLNSYLLIILGPNCQSTDVINQFLISNSNYARITTFTQEYNLKTFEFETIPEDFYYFLNPGSTFSVNLYVTMKTINIEKKGFIFANKEQVRFIGKIDIVTQTIPRISNDQPFQYIWVYMKRTEIFQEIAFPQFPAVLAQFSAVFSGLMMFGIIFSYFNDKELTEKIVHQVGQIYFWDYTSKIQHLSKTEKQQVSPIDNFTFEQLQTALYSKCNIFNLIYEISKLQLAFQTILTQQQLEMVQKMKYSLQKNKQENEEDLVFQRNLLSFDNFKLFFEEKGKINNISVLLNEQSLQENIKRMILANVQENKDIQLFSDLRRYDRDSDINIKSSPMVMKQN